MKSPRSSPSLPKAGDLTYKWMCAKAGEPEALSPREGLERATAVSGVRSQMRFSREMETLLLLRGTKPQRVCNKLARKDAGRSTCNTLSVLIFHLQ